MTLIGALKQFGAEKTYPLSINNKDLLLIHQQSSFYLIENKCGHFGVPLSDAKIKNNEIICSHHGISFSLDTGLVVNRPYENCDPIQLFTLSIENGAIYSPDL